MNDRIIKLSGPDRIRKRPHIIFSRQDAEGVHAMILVLLIYSIQEHQLGLADHVSLTRLRDGSYIIEDNGSGLPIEPEDDINGWQELFYGEFPPRKEGKYVFSIGTDRERKLKAIKGDNFIHSPWYAHFAACAASSFMDVETFHAGYFYRLHFEKGHLIGEVSKTENADGRGMSIHFLPDEEVFEDLNLDLGRVKALAEKQMFANPGLTITVTEVIP